MTGRLRRRGPRRACGAPLLALAALGAAGCQAPVGDEPPATRSAQPLAHEAVLLRGWIGEQAADLEPVLPTAAAPSLQDGGAGPFRLSGFDDAGRLLFELRFGEEALASVPGRPGHHFMLVAAVGAGGASALATLELDAAQGRTAVQQARWPAETLQAALAEVQPSADGQGSWRVRWDAGRFALLQLRDPASGAILALDRDGEVSVAAEGAALEVALSDGVRSAAALVELPTP